MSDPVPAAPAAQPHGTPAYVLRETLPPASDHGAAAGGSAAHGAAGHGAAGHGTAAHGAAGTGHVEAELEHAVASGPPIDLWLLVALVIVIAIAFNKARQALISALDARTEKVRAELDEARRLREEAQALLAATQRRQRDATAEAEEIITHAFGEAARIRARLAEELEQTVARREQQMLERIAQAQAQAIQEIRSLAVDVSMEATRQLLRQGIDTDRARRLIDEAIEEVPRRLIN